MRVYNRSDLKNLYALIIEVYRKVCVNTNLLMILNINI